MALRGYRETGLILFKRRCLTAVLVFLFAALTAQVTYYSKSSGNLNALATWGSNVDGSGASPANFTTPNVTYVIVNNAAATIAAAWNVSGLNSKVVVGDGVAAIAFSIPSTAAFTGTVLVTNNSTLNIGNVTNPTLGTLSAGSTVNYSRAGTQTVLNAAYYNLVTSGSGQKSMASTTNASISNSFVIGSGTTFRFPTANTVTTTITGSLSGSGTLLGNGNSVLAIGGSGAFGTLTFASNFNLYRLSVARTSGTVTLGSNLTVGNSFEHTAGVVDLNGFLMTFNGSITFPTSSANGSFKGSTTSSISIATSASTITNALLFNQTSTNDRTLAYFSLNRASQTLVLGNSLVIASRLLHSNGNINLNGQSLTAGGILTFPAAASNGVYIGSSTSTLVVGGAGTISNSLRLDQTNATTCSLHTFSLNHTGGNLTLGANLVCTTLFAQTTGTLVLGTTSLTLQGQIVFPASAASGSITGSSTSSLAIQGSGSITNALVMSQANTAGRTLNSLLIDRVGETLTMANSLIVNAFTQSNGNLSIGTNSLSLNGAIIFPVSASNGVLLGSTSASLSIGANASAITNSLKFSQASTTVRSLSRMAINRVGQTITLGSNLEVVNNFVNTASIIDLAAQSLTVGGIVTLPTTTTNGYFIGSNSASLSITGSGAITNALRFSTSSTSASSLSQFRMDHTVGAITLGSPLTCTGAFIHNNGSIVISNNSLTLSGSITLPVAASNGSMTGAATSTLIINGSGAISNSLFMSQASNAARTFNLFQFSRASQTLTLGNAFIATTYQHTAGTIRLNDILLTLNGAITFPTNASAGSIAGSLNSSLTIAGSGAITNSLWMDQSTSTSRSLYDLLLSRSTSVLTLGNSLDIINSIRPATGTITAGSFVTLKADAVRSGYLGQITGGFTGTLTCESYMAGGLTGWTNIGAPGISGIKISDMESQIPMTCPLCPYDEYSLGSYFVSVQSFDETISGSAAYVPLSYTSSVAQGNGIWCYLGNGSPSTTAISYSLTGPAITGNFVKALTKTNNQGKNLIANPYAAPIDWDLVAADASNANVSGSVYFFNPDINQTITYAAGASSPSGYIANGVIPRGQGFYVQANVATNITFRESHKSTANTSANPLLKQQTTNTEGQLFRLSVVGKQADYDETLIRFHEQATDTFDRLLDAGKQFETLGLPGMPNVNNQLTTISTRIGQHDYAINSLPFPKGASVEIPVLVKPRVTGTYTISALDLLNFSETGCAILYDKQLNTLHDFRKGPYVCEIADTTSTPRFVLMMCKEAVTGVAAEENKVSQQLVVYEYRPSTLRVVVAGSDAANTVSVYSISGQLIKHEVDIQNAGELDLSGYEGQVVLVKISNTRGVEVRKVLVRG